MAFVIATTGYKGGVDAATLVKNWGIRSEAAKRARLVTNQTGDKMNGPSKFNQNVQKQ
jgi:hypothetical protein